MKNVLLITIDSWRIDYSKSSVENHLQSLSSGSTCLNHAFATGPGTTPSFPAMLTGTLPLSYEGLGPLSNNRPRVAQNFAETGFSTAGFQCNPFLSAHFNYDKGFDIFEDYQNPLMGIATKLFPRGIEISNPKLRHVDDILHLTDGVKKAYQLIKGKPRPYISAEAITDDTIDWFAQTDNRFFCWSHYMDVHHPCYPPSTYRDRHGVNNVTQSEVSEWYSALLREPDDLSDMEIDKLKKLYEASIEYTLDEIERILQYLKETGRYEDTLILITSDHGDLFGEYGQHGKPERMYDELLHVPLIVENGPDYLENAKDDLVSLLDIPPFIHDDLGLEVPGHYQGRIPGKDEARGLIMAEHEVEGEVIVGARSEDWLYEGDEINNEHRLFDLRNDFERVERDHPEADIVRDAVLARLEELDIGAKYLQGDMESDIEDRLEDLGYL